VPADHLLEARRAAQIADTSLLDVEQARHLAMRSAVNTVIDGRIDRLGAAYSLVVRAIDVRSGRVLASAPGVASDGTLSSSIQAAAGRIRDALPHASTAASNPESGAATRSFEAYRKFAEATTQTEFGAPRRTVLLREAIALDPQFAAAWMALGDSYYQRGIRDSAEMAYASARRFANRLTRRESMTLEAVVARNMKRDYEAAAGWWDRIIAEEPSLVDAHVMRALLMVDLARYDDAVASCQRAIALSPFGGKQEDIQDCGNIAAASGHVDGYRTLSARLTGQRQLFLDFEIALSSSDWDRADSLAHALLSTPEGPDCCPNVYVALASTQAARGEIHAAARSIHQAASLMRGVPNATAWLPVLLGVVSGTTPESFDGPVGYRDSVMVAEATGENPQYWDRILFPMVRAWRGDVPRAAREYALIDAADHARGSAPRLELPAVQAMIAYRQRHWDRIPPLLAPDAWKGRNGAVHGNLNLRRWLVADAYEHMGRLDSAAAYFNLLVTTTRGNWPQQHSRGMASTFALRRLALIHDALGERTRAAKLWTQFAATLSNPDPELQPLAAEARDSIASHRWSARGMKVLRSLWSN